MFLEVASHFCRIGTQLFNPEDKTMDIGKAC